MPHPEHFLHKDNFWNILSILYFRIPLNHIILVSVFLRRHTGHFLELLYKVTLR